VLAVKASNAGGSTLETLDVSGASGWRSWLRKNHLAKRGVWLVYHKKGSERPSISYEEPVDEALAFGWIDSVIKKIDDERYARKFTPRRPGSIWSRYNLERVKTLTAQGRMTKWGLDSFAKRTGEVSLLERLSTKELRIPKDLAMALKKNRLAWENFSSFATSYRKRYVMWISDAKKPETRRKRIDEAVILISRNVKNLLK
jgi:uncharacterized protein YdeI (YjbR/CyaY-like superfamily)